MAFRKLVSKLRRWWLERNSSHRAVKIFSNSEDNFNAWWKSNGLEDEETRKLVKMAWNASYQSVINPYLFSDTRGFDSDWDYRFLMMARHIASWSKDPSTQTGAVIVDHNRRVVSVGYNGLPKGVCDTHERLHNRELKYKIISHCERNAIIFAQKNLSNCTLYTWPFMSCSTCASMVIQSGITRCVAPPIPEYLKGRWEDDMEISKQMFKEAGVELNILSY